MRCLPFPGTFLILTIFTFCLQLCSFLFVDFFLGSKEMSSEFELQGSSPRFTLLVNWSKELRSSVVSSLVKWRTGIVPGVESARVPGVCKY